jgi:D-alanyl-D-alanine carboxypeptidase-like protein
VGVADQIPAAVPSGLVQIIDTYGDPKVRWNGTEYVVDRAWESRSMTRLSHGFIPNERQDIYCHRLFAPLLGRLLDAWSVRVRAGDPYRLVKLACFSPRLQRGAAPGSQLYSAHSWGIAIDANEDTNGFIADCPLGDPRRAVGAGHRDIPEAWLDDARQLGLVCGADFHTRFDPMHVQACANY